MDFEQIAQRLEWLDNERRKDKLVISTLEERLTKLERGYTTCISKKKFGIWK